MSFTNYRGSLTGQIFSVPFWNKQHIYGQQQLAEPKLKDFESFQSHLSQYKYFLGISTTSLCFNGMIQDCDGDRRTPFWQLEVTFYRKNHICFCITKKSQCSVALSPHFNLMDILF